MVSGFRACRPPFRANRVAITTLEHLLPSLVGRSRANAFRGERQPCPAANLISFWDSADRCSQTNSPTFTRKFLELVHVLRPRQSHSMIKKSSTVASEMSHPRRESAIRDLQQSKNTRCLRLQQGTS